MRERLVQSVACSLACSLAYLSPQQLNGARKEWRHTGPFTSTIGVEYAGRLSANSFSFTEQLTEPSFQSSATIFDSADTGDVLVAFRGSTNARNFQSMFALGLVPLADCESGANVHEGYQTASQKLYERLAPALERRSGQRVIFTGHSYGGGTATLCALYAQPDQVITFSAPQVGDADFAQTYDATMGSRTIHLVHDQDPVLQQNAQLWKSLGYAHTGEIVRCSPTEQTLLDSGGGGLAWNFLDHCQYLGTYMGPRAPPIKWSSLKPVYRPK